MRMGLLLKQGLVGRILTAGGPSSYSPSQLWGDPTTGARSSLLKKIKETLLVHFDDPKKGGNLKVGHLVEGCKLKCHVGQ